jgi:hypothetical protein
MTASLRTDLNDFLFCPIASDANGMHLTMLSALARSGVDPWDEAAKLAALPPESATQKVVEMLAGMPDGPSPGDPTTSLAAKLVAQLHTSPRRTLNPVASAGVMSRGDELSLLSVSARPARIRWAVCVVAALIVIGLAYRILASS